MKTSDFWERAARHRDVLSTLHTGAWESLGKELPGSFKVLFCVLEGPGDFVSIMTLALLKVSLKPDGYNHSQCKVNLSFRNIIEPLARFIHLVNGDN